MSNPLNLSVYHVLRDFLPTLVGQFLRDFLPTLVGQFLRDFLPTLVAFVCTYFVIRQGLTGLTFSFLVRSAK